MTQFFGVLRHEFNMAVRRPGMWIAFAVLYAFYFITVLSPSEVGDDLPQNVPQMWQQAGMVMFYANMFMVILGGILAADRVQRDFRLGVRELQQSSPLGQGAYILGKYFGVLAAVISPMLLFVIVQACVSVIRGVPVIYLAIMLVAFLAMGVPAFAFVVAFSLACPLFMPVRVYQVLFVGYWFWGNYLSPDVFPTISDTLLVPSGKYVLHGLLGGFPDSRTNFIDPFVTQTQAYLNLALLAGITILVLTLTILHLRRQARQA